MQTLRLAALLGMAVAVGAAAGEPPAKADARAKSVHWALRTADIQGGINNGFGAACGVADASGPCKGVGVWCGTRTPDGRPRCAPPPKQLAFHLAAARRGGAVATTTVPCPAGESEGTATLKLPDAAGPWLLWAGVGGGPSAAMSSYVAPFSRDDDVYVTLFACGCDYAQSGQTPSCATPPR